MSGHRKNDMDKMVEEFQRKLRAGGFKKGSTYTDPPTDTAPQRVPSLREQVQSKREQAHLEASKRQGEEFAKKFHRERIERLKKFNEEFDRKRKIEDQEHEQESLRKIELGEAHRQEEIVRSERIQAEEQVKIMQRHVDDLKGIVSGGTHLSVYDKTPPFFRVTDKDIAVMKGIAESGALDITREVGGLYKPRMNRRDCDNFPNSPKKYISEDFTRCGLYDLVLGDKDSVTIHWSADLVKQASDTRSIMWHTHPNRSDLIHSPPSILDYEVALQAAVNDNASTDQFMITSSGVWRVYCDSNDIYKMSTEQRKEIGNDLLRIKDHSMSIMSDDVLQKFNDEGKMEGADHIDKMTVDELIDLLNRNVPMFTFEFHKF